MVRNSNFIFIQTSSGEEWLFYITTDVEQSRMAISHFYRHLVVRNGNFTFILTSSGQEWQFHIYTDHLLVQNDNFTFLLTSQ